MDETILGEVQFTLIGTETTIRAVYHTIDTILGKQIYFEYYIGTEYIGDLIDFLTGDCGETQFNKLANEAYNKKLQENKI